MDQNAPSLGGKARRLIDETDKRGDVAVSAISFWEIAMLQGKRRIEIDPSPMEWRRRLIESGVVEIPVTGTIAVEAGRLKDLHGDPADRIILATAVQLAAPLLTADRAMLNWPGKHRRIDASK